MIKKGSKEYTRFHRLARKIVSEHIGRKLKSSEAVHHIDGDITNNDFSNLELMSISEHTTFHHKSKGFVALRRNCKNCGKEIIRGKYKIDRVKNAFCSPKCSDEHRAIRPSKIQLMRLMEEKDNNMSAIGRIFGVSCSAVRKWKKKYNL